ncbi:Zinc finger protein CONSTANS-LIKE 4 [Zea mays]|uniref:Zinc finger protein CONSTANS-LIKE 4 n=1 Tax=Zea mays TaxID=4577 RepID=A0A3L6E8W0_MAIZE|nr:Zinc finger protein CONSTANS-LIKE 4 [Zea mays]
MFHPSSSSSPPNYSDLSMHHAVSFSSAVPTAPTEIPRGGFFHGNGGLLALANVAASAPPPYPSSLPSYYIHGNVSSHFLPLRLQLSSEQLSSTATLSCPSPSASACQLPLPHVPSSPSSSSGDLFEFSAGAMRRVFSTGDLQVMNVAASPSPPPLSVHGQDAGGPPCTQKVGRYSAEERREKIERYRTKRNQRNFHKKITYACRKTLADSRPRVQGRFARNAETEAEAVAGHERAAASDNSSYEHCHHSDLTTANSYDVQCRESGKTTTLDDGKWWWETPVAAPAAANGHHQYQQQQLQLQLLDFDMDMDMDMDGEDLWASLADMCSGT